MPIELAREKCAGAINAVEIGSGNSVKIGGETTMPFLFEEGAMPNAPLVALEIYDCEPQDCPDALKEVYGGSAADPAACAKRCVGDYGARALCVRLQSVHPDWFNAPADKAIATLRSIRRAVKVPLIVVGSGDIERDNEVLPKVSQALKGENCLLGIATQANYKTLAATCLADGHSIIAESPIDINIAKQVNILISDMGFDPARIVMHPTTTALGYGMEYVFSIMERARLAAYIGDRMLSMPFVVFVGEETWRTKEARESGKVQGINWEIATAVSMAQSGADLIVMRHPEAARSIMTYIDLLTKNQGGARDRHRRAH